MTPTSRRESRRRPRKAAFATMATFAALSGVGAALPAPAAGMGSDGLACSDSFWIDQFVCIDGDGSGGGSGGGGSTQPRTRGSETIVIVDPALKRKAPVGGPAPRLPRDPDSRPVRDGGQSGGSRHSADPPRKKDDRRFVGRGPEYKCDIYWEKLVFDTRKECDEARRRAEKTLKEDCDYLTRQFNSTLNMPEDTFNDPVHGPRIIADLFSLAERRAARGCDEHR